MQLVTEPALSSNQCGGYRCPGVLALSLQWRHNARDGVSNNQPHDCLLNRLFRRRSKKTPKLRVPGLCAGIHRSPVNSPHKWPVTRKMFPFDDVIIMIYAALVSIFRFIYNGTTLLYQISSPFQKIKQDNKITVIHSRLTKTHLANWLVYKFKEVENV